MKKFFGGAAVALALVLGGVALVGFGCAHHAHPRDPAQVAKFVNARVDDLLARTCRARSPESKLAIRLGTPPLGARPWSPDLHRPACPRTSVAPRSGAGEGLHLSSRSAQPLDTARRHPPTVAPPTPGGHAGREPEKEIP